MGAPVGWTWIGAFGIREFASMMSPEKVEELKAGKVYLDLNGELLDAMRYALGWSGGTVEQVVAEVARLKTVPEVVKICDTSTLVDAMSRHFSNPPPLDELYAAAGGVCHVVHDVMKSHCILGQGVAALLPEHGEAKHG